MATGPFKYMPEPSNGTKNFLPTANFAVRQRRVQSEAPPTGGSNNFVVYESQALQAGNIIDTGCNNV